MISLKHNFLYVHIPKTAGNSVQNILQQYSEDKVVCVDPHHDGAERFEVRSDRFRIRKHSTLAEYRRELGEKQLAKLFRFCCVRNPWDRAISFYFSPHRGPVTWDRGRFIETVQKMMPSSAYLALEKQRGSPFDNVDFVMRFEQLNDDFLKVCERIGIPFTPLPVRNKSERAHYSTYYDPELIELVRDRFNDEVSHFGYGVGTPAAAEETGK
jgi:hypothetical protein